MSATLNESILDSVKHAVSGLETNTNHFDPDILIHINTAFSTLFQLGVGESPFFITGNDETWSSLFGDREDLHFIKTYVILSVKIAFDPPQNSYTLEAYNRNLKELEWRINTEIEDGGY